MGTEVIEYKDLTDFLLGVVRIRPAMYLGEAKISLLPTFIIGYMVGCNLARNPDFKDTYFDDGGFLEWMDQKYHIGQPNSWTTPFLDQSNDDERKALELYFNYLEEYHNEKKL